MPALLINEVIQVMPDVSYTRMPDWIKLFPNYEHDQHVTFWTLARFAFPDTRKANLVPPLPSRNHNVSLPPDEQMLCYDYLYYVCGQQVHSIIQSRTKANF